MRKLGVTFHKKSMIFQTSVEASQMLAEIFNTEKKSETHQSSRSNMHHFCSNLGKSFKPSCEFVKNSVRFVELVTLFLMCLFMYIGPIKKAEGLLS